MVFDCWKHEMIEKNKRMFDMQVVFSSSESNFVKK